MPNVFDQFDDQPAPKKPRGSGNVFDQFDDAPPAAPAKRPAPAARAPAPRPGPTMQASEPSFLDQLGSVWDALTGEGEAIERSIPARVKDAGGRLVDAIVPDAIQRGVARGDRVIASMIPSLEGNRAAGESARRAHMADLQRRAERYPESRESAASKRALTEATSVGGWASALADDPLVLGEIIMESLGQQALPLILQGVAAPLGIASSGATSYNAEVQGAIDEAMGKAGVDLTDPMAVGAFERRRLAEMEDARWKGEQRGSIIAPIDMLTAGLAGRFARNSGLGRVLIDGLMGVSTGAGSEALAQYGSEGEVGKVGAVLTEGVAEGPSTIIEGVANARGELARARAEDERNAAARADLRQRAQAAVDQRRATESPQSAPAPAATPTAPTPASPSPRQAEAPAAAGPVTAQQRRAELAEKISRDPDAVTPEEYAEFEALDAEQTGGRVADPAPAPPVPRQDPPAPREDGQPPDDRLSPRESANAATAARPADAPAVQPPRADAQAPAVAVPDTNAPARADAPEPAARAPEAVERPAGEGARDNAVDPDRRTVQTKDGRAVTLERRDITSGERKSEFGRTQAIVATDADGNLVGRLFFSDDGTPPDVAVAESSRRQGIASAMYDMAEAAGAKFDAPAERPGYRTDDGQAFRTARAERAERAAAAAPAPEPRVIRSEGRAPEPEPPRGDAQNVRGEIGWDQVGGRMIREYDDGGLKPEVTGRTTWVGKMAPDGSESKLWRNRPDKNLTPAQANAALDKAAAGEKLRPIEQRFVDYAASVDAEYQQASRDAAESERAAEEWQNRGDREDARNELERGLADEGGQPADERPRPTGVEPTGTKNAVTDAEREARGAEPIEPASKLSNEALLRQATDALTADPQAAAPIIARLLNEGVTNISARDEAILMAHKQTLRVRRQRAIDALEDPNTGDYERLAAKAEFAATEAEINDLDNAVRNSGREWGRFGQFRQRMLGEDWTLEAMERRHRAVLERPLTTKERAEVKALHEQLASREAELEDVKAKLAEAQIAADVSSTYKNLAAEIAKSLGGRGKKRVGGDLLERRRAAADEAKARLAKNAGVPSKRGQSGALDVGMLADYATIGSYHIAKGVSDFATWARDMLDELGETFRKLSPSEKRQVFDASKAAHEADVAATPAVKTPAAVLEGMDPEAITHRDVYNLARAHAQAGVRGEGPLMQAVHADIQKIAPSMTERDVRRLFSDYGRATFPSKDEDRVALREVRVLVQLQESIDRLQEGLDALKSGPQRDKPTQAIREKRRQLNDLLKLHMQRRGIPEDRLATYNQVRITNLKNQIADLEKQIATGEKPVRAKAPDPSDEVIALTAERDRLKAELKAIEDAKKPVKSEDEKYQERTGKRLQRELDRIRERIKADDYAKPEKPVPRALNEANTRAQRQLQQAKIEFSVRQFEAEMAKRHPVARGAYQAAQAVNLARAIMTSLDLSATLRQGGFITFGHPVRGAKALADGVRAAFSADKAFDFEQQIGSRRNASLYQRAGLELTRSDAYTPSLAEEQFMSRWADKMPVWVGGGLIRGSQRAFVTTLNRIRADTFDAMFESLVKDAKAPTETELKAIADFVNIATGRGRVGIKGKEITGLNQVFFAPKLVASRFQLLGFGLLGGGGPLSLNPAVTARVRLKVAEEYARFLTGVAATLGLLAVGLGDEDDEGDPLGLETDPRSANFLKVKVGNSYLDPLTGLAQVTRLVASLNTGTKVTTTGKERDIRVRGPIVQNELATIRQAADRIGLDNFISLDGLPEQPEVKPLPYGGDASGDVFTRFLRTKLAPIPATIWNLYEGQNLIGEPTTLTGEALSLVTPLSFRDVDKLMRENGVPKGSALMLLNLLGVGVQYRDPEKDYTKLSDKEYAERYEPSDDPRQ